MQFLRDITSYVELYAVFLLYSRRAVQTLDMHWRATVEKIRTISGTVATVPRGAGER
ncbi:hypothetical protein M407DRAFT_245958 [Tulasnella calospora MUT 4182]|uniref:Uncharacterized protein n=1 Tax=Tulasnella calospora MUT 4182 TaxID=1051891 RepID=A0A0C3KF09_9AGAM|nr:hypothetical protein M407DRAFT_245958 [Tulasnella calospora MUT 4182]